MGKEGRIGARIYVGFLQRTHYTFNMFLQETTWINCPYCGERIEILLDGSVEFQEYFEDCDVCCKPIFVTVNVGQAGDISVNVRDENDT